MILADQVDQVMILGIQVDQVLILAGQVGQVLKISDQVDRILGNITWQGYHNFAQRGVGGEILEGLKPSASEASGKCFIKKVVARKFSDSHACICQILS